MMIKGVDFHIRDNAGRVLALVDASALRSLHIDDLVLAEDDEGNRIKAQVVDVIPRKHAVVLDLQDGTFEASPKASWIAGAINY